jgi:predicted metalloendopeptidase
MRLLLTCCALIAVGAPLGAAVDAAPLVLGSGIDASGFDRSVRPQDDLFRYVNGGWIARTEIPADKSNYGSFTILADNAERDLRAIIEEAAADTTHAPGSDSQKIGDMYASFMKTARIAKLGVQPLMTEFRRIDAIRDRAALVDYFGRQQHISGDTPDTSLPLDGVVNQDAKDTTRYITYWNQGGLGLPDRDYYLRQDEKFAGYRAAYVAYVERVLALAGQNDAHAVADRIMKLETRLAEAQWSREDSRDADKTYNRYSAAAANKLTPGFDWTVFLSGAHIPAGDIVLSQPSYFAALARTIDEVPLAEWRSYLKYHAVDAYAPYLGDAFVQANFDMYGKTLRGAREIRPRWKRGVQCVEDGMGEMAGRLYVARHFKPEAKARIDQLVKNVLAAMDADIDELDWMGPDTKQRAHAKLAQFTVKIAYPDKWRDYGRLEIRRDDLVGNVMRAKDFETQRQLAKLGAPIDRTEWGMTPQTVNAYYNPVGNEIVFPAAILQPPFFNVAADDAVNYGGIGAVIGHEISHGFDDQGRKFDGDGNLKDWWTAHDKKEFTDRADRLAAEFDGFSSVPGHHLNGRLTLGENIGDLSGMAIAYKAYRRSLGGAEAPLIDGYTGDQRFYLGYAQIWRRKYQEADLIARISTDPHSPAEFRVNGIVTNLEPFYRAFDLKPGDRLYRTPDDRVRIW